MKYEGEYFKDEKNGKGKEFYETKELLFEGIYLNGKRLKGIEYNKAGGIIFEGEYNTIKDT